MPPGASIPADAPVAVLGPPAAADVDEGRLADLAHIGQVGVPEGDRLVRVLPRHAFHGRRRSVLEQVLVDAPRAAVHGEDVAGGSLQEEVVLERAQVGLDLVADYLLGPCERGGAFGALLLGLVDAAAVAELEADTLVVLALWLGMAESRTRRATSLGEGP